MKKLIVVLMVLGLLVGPMALPASAGSPIDEKVTGGTHFESERDGGYCYLSLTAMEKDGEWSGHGRFMDKESQEGHRIVAIITIDDGRVEDSWHGNEKLVQVYGTVDYYEDNVFIGQKQVRIGLVDEVELDGIVDRLGVNFQELGTDITSGSDDVYQARVTDAEYDGVLKIH